MNPHRARLIRLLALTWLAWLPSTPAPAAGADPAAPRALPLVYPNGLALDREGNLFISDIGTHQVVRFSPEGKLTLVAGMVIQASVETGHYRPLC